MDAARAAYGAIDILVCNAALNPFFGPSQEIPDAAFDKVMQANIGSVHRLCKLVIPDMADAGGRGDHCLLHRRSQGQREPGSLCRKAADMQIARNLAVEWGPKNIRVNCIAPGLIPISFCALWENPEIYQDTVSKYPLRRIGEPDEIAGSRFWRPLPAVLQPGRLLSLMAVALSQGDGFIGYA